MLLSFNRYDIFLREGAFLPLGECRVRNLKGRISWPEIELRDWTFYNPLTKELPVSWLSF